MSTDQCATCVDLGRFSATSQALRQLLQFPLEARYRSLCLFDPVVGTALTSTTIFMLLTTDSSSGSSSLAFTEFFFLNSLVYFLHTRYKKDLTFKLRFFLALPAAQPRCPARCLAFPAFVARLFISP